MPAYYNESDPFAAAWLRELIKAGHIADGEVDERSIEDVTPGDLVGFTQCHCFAGIGVWSHALRRAGWPDDRPVWTGSCPCQPFSAAGKGAGFADERHLWPAFHHLIQAVRPVVCFGEQVASKDGLAWLDLVEADLEGTGYAFGAVDTCAAGFGAPHIRQRLYWVADAAHQQHHGAGVERKGRGLEYPDSRGPLRMAHNEPQGLQGWIPGRPGEEWRDKHGHAGRDGAACGLADDFSLGRQRRQNPERPLGDVEAERGEGLPDVERGGLNVHPRPTHGHWRDADWLLCRDGKWRAVEPGSFPLAHGAARRVGRLRGYGNAIAAPQAQAFIEAYMEVNP